MSSPIASAQAPAFARGAAWSALNALGGVALPFIVFIAFARWLSPAQVGVAVLATSLAEIVKAFGAPGLYEALLQQGPGAHRHHQTALAALLILGTGLTAVFAALIAILGRFLPSVAEAGWLLDVVGLRILFDLATTQPQAALAQRLSFGRMASRSIVANVGAGLFGGLIALSGHPFEGLIAYLTAQSVLIFATTAIGTGVLVRPRLWHDCIADMRREAFAASIVRLVAAANNYLDQIVVAGMIGSARLAFFNLGKRVETTFITAASSFSTILFQPLFSLQATARAAGLRNGLAMLTVICGAPAAFMVANAPGVIHVVFGERWAEAAPVAAILACSGFARALGSVHGALLSVSRRNHQLMWVTSVSATSGIALVVVLSPFGIGAVAAALALKNAAMVAWMAVLTRHDFPRSGSAYVLVVALPFAAMLGASYGVHAGVAHLLGGVQGGQTAALVLSGCSVPLAGLAALAPSLGLPASLRSLNPFRRPPNSSWSIAP
ncbi:MAG: oligosaccharide flippase family protein [Acetobacteraceae bacterium]|nr:oligosaccharide flippase family protein [Acetobacteraceae bacterium]